MISETKFNEVFGKGQAMTKEYLNSPAGMQRRAKVWELIRSVEGPRSLDRMAEAIGTSDFSYLLTADMNAQLLDAHARYPVSYPMWTKRVTCNDFKEVPLIAFERPIRMLQKTSEYEGRPKTSVGEGQYTIQIDSYSDTIELTRKAIINDALGAFNSIPEGFSQGAAMRAEYLATSIIADASGPHASMFDANTTYKNLITSELSYDAVKSLWKKMAAQKDAAGLSVMILPKTLIVPPELAPTAYEIANAISVEYYELASEVGYKITGKNQFAGLQVAVDQMITQISTSNTYANKQWYLCADPNMGRPAVAFGVYTGAQTPRLLKKTPDTEIIGGGMDQFSFGNRTIEYGCEWDIAAARLDYRYIGASKPTS